MTNITRFDFTAYRPDEAIVQAAAAWFRGHRRYATHFRVDYGTMANIILTKNPRREDLIVEESRAYLVVLIPTGHLLVYMDPELPQGQGFIMSESPKDEAEVLFAF